MNVVPDTSVVVDGRVSERVDDGEFAGATVYVPQAVVGELEAQANSGRDIGWQGLEELQRLADFADEGEITVEYVGRRANTEEIERARSGAIDAIIRDVADEYDAAFLTSDIVQAEVAKAQSLDVEYLEPYDDAVEELAIESYFTEETMSVHLKTGVRPMAKRGDVGNVRYEAIGEEVLDDETMREYVSDVRNAADVSDDGFTELSEPGMTIVQFRDYRIAIAQPPFSDGVEITAVRPMVKTTMDDYAYSEDITERLLDHQRGVLIAGAPGAGKSTYAQAVAEFLSDADYSVKTMEKPRDLQVGEEITQYTELDGDMDKTADALLMVRPDYTVYDEVRKTADFRTFADMRLAGVGMVGVVHATRAIDALQRLIGRVELGMIPQVVDTVAYIEAGDVETIYDVSTEVKVPHGLMEEDLARPVIVVSDHETQRPEYEIYTFNRQVVTVPLDEADGESDTGVDRLARNEIEREVRSVARGHVQVELQSQNRAVVYVEEDDISYVIGKGGGRIDQIEDSLGIDIDVRTLDERPDHHRGHAGADGTGGSGGSGNGSRVSEGPGHAGEVVTPEITSRHIIVPVDGRAGETVEVRADGDYLFTATVSRGGEIQVSRGSAIAEEMEQAIDRSQQITVVPS
ncbi:PINc/VapC family ATPase [Halomarina oriensis]|uniref:PIN domain-containing protein n=1 Tax=Halomarina oriensis TaxID=671145 RepID=A0A6B0GY38_9EURY|nr:PINc/VapC family ATPase [Halomarina oriensis]MWG36698.1 PIN domain-containing protein [Halomarina oriensis]